MPYCAKCGVEVESTVKKCPLCNYNIPVIEDEDKNKVKNINQYPTPINIYNRELLKIKNRIFYSILVFILSTLTVFLFLDIKYDRIIIDYFIISSVASIFYIYFSFGYLKIELNLFGIAVTTLLFSYYLSNLQMNRDWYYNYALPIIILVTLSAFLIIYLYKRNRFKNQFIYIPVFISIFTTIISVGIDLIVNYNLKKIIEISWSIVVMAVSIPIIIILLGIYYKLPETVRFTLKKKFHM